MTVAVTTQTRATRAASATRKARQPQYKAQAAMVAALKAYSEAHALAIKNGTKRPHISDFVK